MNRLILECGHVCSLNSQTLRNATESLLSDVDTVTVVGTASTLCDFYLWNAFQLNSGMFLLYF